MVDTFPFDSLLVSDFDTAQARTVTKPLKISVYWQKKDIARQVSDMLEKSVIAPQVLIRNWCPALCWRVKEWIDEVLRGHENPNERTESDPCPLSRIDNGLHARKDSDYFFELAPGYGQNRMKKDSKAKIAI